jgi:ferredoxin
VARTHTVVIEHAGKTHELSVRDGTSILEAALDKGIDLPHDCKLGVCMTCPAKLVSQAPAPRTPAHPAHPRPTRPAWLA